MEGWIKIHRKLMSWEWYHDSKMVHLFIHLLLSANHKDKAWKGIPVKRGQVITGRKQLSDDTGISEQQLRTCINRLKSTSEITIQPTNRFSLITIIRYEEFQGESTSENEDESTNDQPATNQQSTTTKKDKNVKNDNNPLLIEARKSKFILDCTVVNTDKKIIPAVELMAPLGDLRETFVSYWTRTTPQGKKMKFEKCDTFDIGRRLTTWKRNLEKYGYTKNKGNDRSGKFQEVHDGLGGQ